MNAHSNGSHPTEDEVRVRAYEIFLRRGGQTGHEIDDWVQAENELKQQIYGKVLEAPVPKQRKRKKTAVRGM